MGRAEKSQDPDDCGFSTVAVWILEHSLGSIKLEKLKIVSKICGKWWNGQTNVCGVSEGTERMFGRSIKIVASNFPNLEKGTKYRKYIELLIYMIRKEILKTHASQTLNSKTENILNCAGGKCKLSCRGSTTRVTTHFSWETP